MKSVDKSAAHLALIRATKSSSASSMCVCVAVCICAYLYLCIYANDNDLCRRRCRRDRLLAWALWVIARSAQTHIQIFTHRYSHRATLTQPACNCINMYVIGNPMRLSPRGLFREDFPLDIFTLCCSKCFALKMFSLQPKENCLCFCFRQKNT